MTLTMTAGERIVYDSQKASCGYDKHDLARRIDEALEEPRFRFHSVDYLVDKATKEIDARLALAERVVAAAKVVLELNLVHARGDLAKALAAWDAKEGR